MTEYKDAEAIKAQIREVCRDCWNIQRVGGCVMHCGINDAIKAVDAVPTVDAVPARHGKWVDENGNRPYGYRFNWLCSECGRPQHTSTAKLLKEFEEEHRWCHFCGARMDGKDGDSNESQN